MALKKDLLIGTLLTQKVNIVEISDSQSGIKSPDRVKNERILLKHQQEVYLTPASNYKYYAASLVTVGGIQ